MMKTITLLQGQSLFDIALQHCGSMEAAFDIAALNDIAVTDNPAGMALQLPAPIDTMVVTYYKNNDIKPATAQIQENSIKK